MSIPTAELVPGDVVHIKAGDVVPADMRCAQAVDLRVDEAVLTGESAEVSKHVEIEREAAPYPRNMLFATTAVVAGKATGIVFATGMLAQVGAIARRLTM